MSTPRLDRPPVDRTVRTASTAVFAVFFLSGLNFASWASRLPAVRDGLGLTPARMGLLLLVGSAASLVGLPLAGVIVERLGARRTVMTFASFNAGGLAIAAVGAELGHIVVVGVGLVVYGFGTGLWDAAMNVEGAFVEQRLGRTVMPRYHAGFSFGTMAAAGLAALAAAAHVKVGVHLPVVLALSTVAVAISVRSMLPDTGQLAAVDDDAEADPHAAPRGARGSWVAWTEARTLLIGLVVMAAALTEGSANDWLSLAVVDGFATSHVVGALVFGVFVTAMTAMRMFGTNLLDRYGRVPVLRLCGALALVGLLVFGLAGPLWLALLGVVVWGMGSALGFPVGMSAASDQPLRAAARVAVVSTIGYAAFLAGPPLLGLLAQHVGYRHALLAIAVPAALGLLVAQAAAPPRSGAAAGEASTLDA